MVLGIAVGFWLLYQIRWVLFIFFIAVIIGTALKPVVHWLRQQGVPQILSMVLVYVLLSVILIGFVVLLVPTLVEQADFGLRTVSDLGCPCWETGPIMG